MSIFGNLFNYDKPGPGIDKNTPKKKGAALFFQILGEKFWKMIPLSLLYWLLCLPVVTVGLADVGIAYITRNFAREKPVFLTADFFSAIKKNCKQALGIGLLNLLITVVLIFAMAFYLMNWDTTLWFKVGFVIAGILFIIFSFMKYYINILVVTFDLKCKQVYRNSLLLSSAGLKQNLIITGVLLGIYAVLYGIPLLCMYYFSNILLSVLSILITILFVPAIQAFIIQFCVFPVVKQHMIDPYYEAHPEEKNKLNLLNLDEDEEDNEDALFVDRGSDEVAVETNETTIPKQYSHHDMKQIRKQRQSDEDDTI